MPFAPPPIIGGQSVARPVSFGSVSTPDVVVTGEELVARAHHAAHQVPPGVRVAVDADDVLTRLCWFLGADLAGSATLLIEPTWTSRERGSVLADADPAMVVGEPVEPGSEPVRPVGDDTTLFYLPTTSGSSGRPRVMIRTRRSWLRSFDVFDLGLRPDDRVLVPGPLSSSLFLFGALHALHEGCDLHLLERWSVTEAAEACRRATVIHVVPAMISALVSAWEQDPSLLGDGGVRKIVCGGARVDDSLRERLGRVLPECELIEYYGAAEQSLVAMRQDGALRPVVEVEVRDDQGASLPPEQPGRLWARSELMFDGYLDEGSLHLPADWRDGWSSVGDRAVLHHDGSLTVHGRSSSTISTGAKLVAAEEVESVLRQGHGVLDVMITATPHPRLGSLVTAVIEADQLSPPTLRALRELARAELESAKRPRRWLVTPDLPRTSAGKPARGLVAERIREGVLVGEPLV